MKKHGATNRFECGNPTFKAFICEKSRTSPRSEQGSGQPEAYQYAEHDDSNPYKTAAHPMLAIGEALQRTFLSSRNTRQHDIGAKGYDSKNNTNPHIIYS